MQKIIENICQNLNLDPFQTFIAARGNKKTVLVYDLIEALLIYGSGNSAIKELGYSGQTFNRNIKKLFPDVTLNGGGETWSYYLLNHSSYKLCHSCDTFKFRSNFSVDNYTSDKLDKKCKDCKSLQNKKWYESNKEYHKQYLIENRSDYVARTAKRRAMRFNATPKWANLEAIKAIYKACPKGYHVDHIIPLQGENVCGLHIPENLQYLTAEENLKKSNKFNGIVG